MEIIKLPEKTVERIMEYRRARENWVKCETGDPRVEHETDYEYLKALSALAGDISILYGHFEEKE